MLDKNFDPYKELQELKKFAEHVDRHLGNVLRNEKQYIIAINNIAEKQARLENSVKYLKKLIKEMKDNETSREKR